MTGQAGGRPDAPYDPARGRAYGSGRGFALFSALLVVIGLAARLRAAIMPDSEMFRSFPTEDGYLMLTVARNLALGHGLSAAAGTIPTNGVQPLAALVQAAGFWLTGGDRAAGVRLLIVLYAALGALCALLIRRLGLQLLGNDDAGRRASTLAGAIWFASPVVLFHTMNMLETLIYAALVVAVMLALVRGHSVSQRWPAARCLGLGGLLGLAFWGRNDAVFLMGAVGAVHLATAGREVRFGRRLAEGAIMAGAALAISLPWLAYGVHFFGSIVPISGHAYLRSGAIEPKLSALAIALFEYCSLVMPFEYSPLQGSLGGVCGALLAVLAVVGGLRLRHSLGEDPRARLLFVPLLFGAGLAVFYVFFFDAAHFLRRYLFPLSPFLALAWGLVATRLWRELSASRRLARLRVVVRPIGAIALVLLLAHLGLRDALLVQGAWRRGPLVRGVDWLEASVPADAWVGAFQSGTLGFFHDRTINLDGKVNPEALEANASKRLIEYVLDSPIEYLVDWASIVEPWSKDARIQQHFETIVLDRERNFAVLRRRSSPTLTP